MAQSHRDALNLETIAQAIKALQLSSNPRVRDLFGQYDAENFGPEALHLANDLYDEADHAPALSIRAAARQIAVTP